MAVFSVALWSWRGQEPFSTKSQNYLWTILSLGTVFLDFSWSMWAGTHLPPQPSDLSSSALSPYPTSYFPTPVPLSSPSLLHFLTHPQTLISLILPFPYSCPRWLTCVYKHNLLTFLYLNQATSPFSLPLARKRGAWRGQERWDSRPRWPAVAIAQSTQIGSPWYLAHSCSRDLQSILFPWKVYNLAIFGFIFLEIQNTQKSSIVKFHGPPIKHRGQPEFPNERQKLTPSKQYIFPSHILGSAWTVLFMHLNFS